MIGLCFEGDTPCSSCGFSLPLNAMVETIICTQCSQVNTFDVDDWKDLLEELFKEAPTFADGEGRPSSMMGSRNYKLMHGKQNPRFPDKTFVNMEEAVKSMTNGKILDPATKLPYSIRPVPEKFKSICENVHYILGEDFTLLPNYSGKSEVVEQPSKGGLIPFTCPSCAGSLQINGSERLFKCNFCSTESYIPDDTWQKMHPAKPKTRFYFWYDEKTVKFEWEDDLWDIIADEDGVIYMSLEPMFSSDGDLLVVALNPDLTVKWKQSNLKFKYTTSEHEPRIDLTSRGELIVWSGDRSAMMLLSKADGTELKRIGKKSDAVNKEDSAVMDFAQCIYIAADIDGNYFAYIDRDKGEMNVSSYYEFMVIDEAANLHKPWNAGENKKGFFGSLKKAFSGMGEAPYFDKLKDQPTICRDYDMVVSVGLDGFYYLHSHSNIAKYDRVGEQVYSIKIEEGYIQHKLVADKQGNAYFISRKDDKEILNKISPDGEQMTTLIENVLDGGSLCEEDKLALSANGTFYCAGYSGRFRMFNMEGKLVYASPQSLEEEVDNIKEQKEKED